MNRTPRRSRRVSTLLYAVVLAIAALLPAGSAMGAEGGPKLTVLTRNLYLGTGLDDLVTAQSQEQFVAAASRAWATVVATDFPARAKALAQEIVHTRPDVVGLQEVSLWREQLISDTVQGNRSPNAPVVAYDFLAILQGELAAAGAAYTAAATSVNADVEAPRVNAASPIGFSDVRLTDRDVILVRTPLASKVTDAADGRYRTQLTLPTAGGPVSFTRGWTSIDYRHSADHVVRVVNTHLEVANPPVAGQVQLAQGIELLDLVAAAPHPVIALGDFNSAADGSTTPTYAHLTSVLDDAWTGPGGPTCCQDERLDNAESQADEPIDLVLTRGSWQVRSVALVGDQPFQDVAPHWASDHHGVVARLALTK